MNDHTDLDPAAPAMTQPREQVADVRSTLARLLPGEPTPRVLAVSAALAHIDDVVPPHPPLATDLPPLDPVGGVELALTQLSDAIGGAAGIPELVRLARAAIELRAAL